MSVANTLKSLVIRELEYCQSKPNFATFELTYRCNLTCKTCGVWKDSASKEYIKNEIPFQRVKELLFELKEMGVRKISLLGGETLIRKDIIEIVRLVKELGFSLTITTNATMINEDIAKEIVTCGVDVINYSLDAAEKDHDKVRGIPGTFKRAKRGIEYIKEAKKKFGSEKPYTCIATTISKLNYDKFDKLAPISQELKVDSFALGYISQTKKEDVDKSTFDGKVISTDYFLPNQGESLLLDRSEIKVLRSKIKELKKLPYRNMIFTGTMDSLDDETLENGRYCIEKCYATRSRIIIDPVGNVVPCANLRELSYGNVKSDSIKSVWQGTTRKKFMQEISKKLFPVCANCCHSGQNMTFSNSIKRAITDKLNRGSDRAGS